MKHHSPKPSARTLSAQPHHLRRKGRTWQPFLILGAILLAVALAVWKGGKSHANSADRATKSAGRTANTLTGSPTTKDDNEEVSALVTDEETLLVLARKMELLSKDLLAGRLAGPSAESGRLFAPLVTAVDLGPAPETQPTAVAIETRPWPASKTSVQVARVDLWRSLLDGVASFAHAEFRLTDGRHPEGNLFRYQSLARFEALGQMKSGEWRSFRGNVEHAWERSQTPDGKTEEWRITGWITGDLTWNASPRRLFVEALDAALRPPQDPQILRRSQHYEAALSYYRDGMKKPPHPYFAPISVNQKEGIAIADVNGDGFDDIYITVRLGKNMLLINHGDGTFSEQAARFKLDLPGHTTCAIFADFDNDGDKDVMLGRSLLRTSYLENRGGTFYQPPIPKFMPMAVISMTAADYNSDGLLDIYLCTYRPAPPSGSGTSGGYAEAPKESDFDWPDEFFSPELARDFRRRLGEHKKLKLITVLDQLGPPNVLLVNRGGGQFEPAPESSTVGLWRNSLQATWCDYNEDGRPDLYIPNDWGMNVLFRNDMPAGFADVTVEAGLGIYGFSMGASFGDYDNDGREDLYVSNMYSEAGRRISARIPGLDPMFADSANGNFLYHREPNGRFKQVAGIGAPAMLVKKIGWSWGGCFADFDNDTFLDLYVMSGYYTAPKELASGLDLESNLWRTMVRADEKLSRAFRFSPEWRRTPAPDNLGPQIDARLAGVERQGEGVLVHSLHGSERNRYFSNRAGKSFEEVSGIAGLDNPADSRGFGLLDYDRDGWLDMALVNANQPLFNLYHNEMAGAGIRGGVIAIRFVGGNRTAVPSKFACRDGYGARASITVGKKKIIREHRCGEGWSTQHSTTMLVGVGSQESVDSVTVRWPSGHTSTTQAVPEGTLLTVFENPNDSPSKESFTREVYRLRVPSLSSPISQSSSAAIDRSAGPITSPLFAVRTMDTAAKPARLHVYTTFITSSATAGSDVTNLRQLKEDLGSSGIDFVAVPIDPSDDIQKLAAYAKQWKPTARLINLTLEQKGKALEAYAQALGQAAPTPATVITDHSGRIVSAHPGLPTGTALRKIASTIP